MAVQGEGERIGVEEEAARRQARVTAVNMARREDARESGDDVQVTSAHASMYPAIFAVMLAVLSAIALWYVA
jgi:hypothetical protein